MTIREKQLLAWLDGELDDAGAREVEQAVQADPALMVRAEAHFLTMMQLRAAFAPLLEAPFPGTDAAVEPTEVATAEHDLQDTASQGIPANAQPDFRRSGGIGARAALARSAIRRWGLLVAVLLLGLLIGRFVLGSTPPRTASQGARSTAAQGDIIRDQEGTLVAAGALADTLQNGLPAGDAEPIRIPLSFHDKTGRLCRSFDTVRLAGIACRDDDGWRLRLTLQTSSGGRPASSESPFVGQAIDAMIAGNPLDAGEQQAARERGWR